MAICRLMTGCGRLRRRPPTICWRASPSSRWCWRRGLDVTPEIASRLERARDTQSAEILRHIYRDEIGHVAVGLRWFEHLCRARGLVPETVFHERVRRCFKGNLKPPFNHEARAAAGFPACYYEPLAGSVPI
jgi:uncharacterized ferritin-like protein (DUF455 family)